MTEPKRLQKTDDPWMTDNEKKAFSKQVKAGNISFFKTSFCKFCKSAIPANTVKLYCSKECFLKDGNVDEEEDTAEDDADQW